jgi:predicted DNA-binding transcriptional regulator YafY
MFQYCCHLHKILYAMSRAQRLLDLLQILRRHRFPVTGACLAEELGISLRTLYRDIATLEAQGARIDAEPGLGYVLRPGYMLPPLMFSEEEIEALVLGMRWAVDRGDSELSVAAREVLAKIAAVLPDDLRHDLDTSALLVVPMRRDEGGEDWLPLIRRAIRAERVIELQYRDANGTVSTRIVWPFALGYFDHVRIVAAWCTLRGDFRHFRADRIVSLQLTDARYPRRRQVLLHAWREREGIPHRS